MTERVSNFCDSGSTRNQIATLLALALFYSSQLAPVLAERFDYQSVRGRKPSAFLSGRYEGEQMEMRGQSRPQPMNGFGNQWSGNGQLLWDGTLGATLETSFEVEQGGQFDIAVQLTLAPDYGQFDLSLNEVDLANDIDLFDKRVKLAPIVELKNIHLPAGLQSLKLTLVGQNAKAKMIPGDRLLLGIDYIHLKRLDPPTPTKEEAPSAEQYPPAHALPLAQLTASFEQHCYTCHSGDEVEGEVALDQLTTHEQLFANIKTTQKIRDVIQRHEMPPENEEQPSKNLRAKWKATFDRIIDDYIQKNPSQVPTVMRRMNRYEYSNAVRDLLNLKGDIYPLPEKTIRADAPYFDPASGRFPKSLMLGNRTLGKNQIEQKLLTGVTPFAIDLQSEGGFNNRGSELSVSPILLESFLSLGRSIVNAPEFNGYCKSYTELFEVAEDTPFDAQRAIARKRLAALLERAFRRPVTDGVLTRYSEFFAAQLAETGSFSQSMKRVLAGILASPKFIYLSESSKRHGERLDAWELASRLSFFVWSSLPDEELLAAARDGSLTQPNVLDAQLLRMLEHPRSQALSLNFARQWLRLDQLITAVPDFERYEEYYSRIGCEQWKLGLQSMLEPLLLFESIMVEDRSIMLLLDSNYTYRTDELQSWYRDEVPFNGKQNRNRFQTHQQQYRRRKISDRREGGVITSAATLTMTSAPLRTSPIVRGAWVATVIFNQPPPPPPDDVPSIEADEKAIEAKGQTLRQRLVQHQENQSCASCHSKIDPLGFALENFDAVGRWRNAYGSGLPIDASGKLFGEAEFDDVIGLKNALLDNPEWFMRAFCEHMTSYALARELEVSDEVAIDDILATTLATHGQFTEIVRAIVRSQPFRSRTPNVQPKMTEGPE